MDCGYFLKSFSFLLVGISAGLQVVEELEMEVRVIWLGKWWSDDIFVVVNLEYCDWWRCYCCLWTMC